MLAQKLYMTRLLLFIGVLLSGVNTAYANEDTVNSQYMEETGRTLIHSQLSGLVAQTNAQKPPLNIAKITAGNLTSSLSILPIHLDQLHPRNIYVSVLSEEGYKKLKIYDIPDTASRKSMHYVGYKFYNAIKNENDNLAESHNLCVQTCSGSGIHLLVDNNLQSKSSFVVKNLYSSDAVHIKFNLLDMPEADVALYVSYGNYGIKFTSINGSTLQAQAHYMGEVNGYTLDSISELPIGNEVNVKFTNLHSISKKDDAYAEVNGVELDLQNGLLANPEYPLDLAFTAVNSGSSNDVDIRISNIRLCETSCN